MKDQIIDILTNGDGSSEWAEGAANTIMALFEKPKATVKQGFGKKAKVVFTESDGNEKYSCGCAKGNKKLCPKHQRF